MRRALTACLLITASLPITRSALACEPGACLRALVPADGAAGVATDAVLWLHHDQVEVPVILTVDLEGPGQLDVTTAMTEEPHGTLTEVSNRLVAIRPSTILEPGTQYSLRVDVEPAACAPSLTSTFVTGAGPVGDAPLAYAGATSVTVSRESFGGTDCDDGDPERWAFVVHGTSSAAAGAYRLYHLEAGTPVHVDSALTPELRFDLPAPAAAGEHCFIVRAVGASGIEEGNAVQVCATVEGDAATPDAGPQADAGQSCACPGEGCACAVGSSGRSPTAGGVLLLAALAALALRSRRRPLP